MDETFIRATRVIDAEPHAIFAVLSDPCRHPALDGSGMVRDDDDASAVTGVGQVFRMHVHHPQAGDYRTDNIITRYEPGVAIAWRTGELDADPPGWEWTWRLVARGIASTEVSVSYDWSDVHDPAVLELLTFPVVPLAALERSLTNLAAICAVR